MKKLKEEFKYNKNGITLISLVVTIIILLILAGVTIGILFSDNGIITKASIARIAHELSIYKENMGLWALNKTLENEEFKQETITGYQDKIYYDGKAEDSNEGIRNILGDVSEEFYTKLEIIKGELYISTTDKTESKAAEIAGIKVSPFDIKDGVLLSTGNNLNLVTGENGVTIPPSVTSIGEGAFANVENLTSITIPGTVKRIEKNAFAYNTSLVNVTIEEGVEYIGDSAFLNCANIRNIELPDSVEYIGASCFYNCSKLEQVEVPSRIESINSFTFGACYSLRDVTLPKNLKKIDTGALSYTNITEIDIPSTVITIENGSFDACKKLERINLNGNTQYVYESGMLMNISRSNILFISDQYLSGITTFSIPNGITNFSTRITQYANIKKIIIPSSLIQLDANKFPKSIENIEVLAENEKYVSELGILYTKDTGELVICYSKEENITIKEGIKKLNNYSFKQATNARTIKLPDTLEEIGSQVFNNCLNLEEIKIGANVSKIEPLFNYMNYNVKVTIDAYNNYYMVENNILYSKDKKTLVNVMFKIEGAFTVESDVDVIGDCAFHNQNGMKEVIIPEGIRQIGNSFQACGNLKKVEIPSTVESIANRCFSQCKNLDEININKGENLIAGAPWSAAKGMKAVKWKK